MTGFVAWPGNARQDATTTVALLGLCPLLAVSTSLAQGLALGLATLAVLAVTSTVCGRVAGHVPEEARIGVFVALSAGLTGGLDLLLSAGWPGLRATLGVFLPLVVATSLVLAPASAVDGQRSTAATLRESAATGLRFLWILCVVGLLREPLSQGTLGAELSLLLGGTQGGHGLRLFEAGHGLHLLQVPAGGFLLLGLLLAARNAWRSRSAVDGSVGARAAAEDVS